MSAKQNHLQYLENENVEGVNLAAFKSQKQTKKIKDLTTIAEKVITVQTEKPQKTNVVEKRVIPLKTIEKKTKPVTWLV